MPKSAQVKLWFSLKVFVLQQSAIVKHLVPWICYFFHSNHKVHSAHMALSHLWFAFVSCLKQGLCSSKWLSSVSDGFLHHFDPHHHLIDPRFKVPTIKHLESVMIWGSVSCEMGKPKAGFYFLPKKQKMNGKT